MYFWLRRILKETEGSVELEDPTPLVPGLVHKKGLSTWKLADKSNQFFATFEEVPEQHMNLMRPHMFPPSEEEKSKYSLDR